MKSLVYLDPRIYGTLVNILYLGGLKLLGKLVGRKRSVFEAACGYGRMQKYLDPSCSYAGIDLNEKFVTFARKRNLDVRLGNVLDSSQYKESDVILLADILHHLNLKDMKKLLAIARRYAKEKIVIIEPVFVDLGTKNNIFSRALAKFMLFMDHDGINDIEKWMTREEYEQLYETLKKENDIKEMKVTYHRNHDFVEMYV